MKITAVRLRRVRGTMTTDGPFWEDRLVQPIDIYPEYRNRLIRRAARRSIRTVSASRRASCRSTPTRG